MAEGMYLSDESELAIHDMLRDLPDWETKGRPHLEELFSFIASHSLTWDAIEAVSDSLWSTQAATLKGYIHYVKAWKTRYRQLYEKQPQVIEHRNGGNRY